MVKGTVEDGLGFLGLEVVGTHRIAFHKLENLAWQEIWAVSCMDGSEAVHEAREELPVGVVLTVGITQVRSPLEGGSTRKPRQTSKETHLKASCLVYMKRARPRMPRGSSPANMKAMSGRCTAPLSAKKGNMIVKERLPSSVTRRHLARSKSSVTIVSFRLPSAESQLNHRLPSVRKAQALPRLQV